MNHATYSGLPGINWSVLKHMDTSAMLYDYVRRHGSPDTAARLFGRAVHKLTLEDEEAFDADWILTDIERRGTNEWKDLVKANPGKEIIKQTEFDHWMPAVDKVLGHPEALALLEDTHREQILQWVDGITGQDCKGRADALGATGLIDLKTCGPLRKFEREIERMRYDAQLAYYHDGILAASGMDLHPWIIAVEGKAPHDVAVFDMEHGLATGRRHIGELLELVKGWRERNEWPGRCPGISEYVPSAYLYPDPDDELTFAEDS